MWLLNGAGNFLPFAIVPVVLAIAMTVPFRRPRWTLFAGVPLLGWAVLMFGGNSLVANGQGCVDGVPSLRVMTANVLMSNGRLHELARDVLGADADVVVFQELREDVESFSPELAAAYPYRVSTSPRWVTIASRWPLRDTRQVALASDDPAREPLATTLVIGDRPVTLIATHVMPPLNAAANRLHTAQYRLLTSEVQRSAEGPLLVVGDFNATPLSPTFARFLWSTGLRVAAYGGQLLPTHFPRPLLGLRIDHVVQRGFDVCGDEVVPLTGSDHRGVAVDLHLRGTLPAQAARPAG